MKALTRRDFFKWCGVIIAAALSPVYPRDDAPEWPEGGLLSGTRSFGATIDARTGRIFNRTEHRSDRFGIVWTRRSPDGVAFTDWRRE